jgi:hypothetical protein
MLRSGLGLRLKGSAPRLSLKLRSAINSQPKKIDGGKKGQSDEKPIPLGGASSPKLPVKFCFG